MAESLVPVDFANPGQVFACLGLVEVADVLLGGAKGAFDWRESGSMRFQLSASGGESPVTRVMRFLEEASVTSLASANSIHSTKKWDVDTRVDDSGVFPYPDPSSPATLPARLEDSAGNVIMIDHWGDATRRDNVKFWAGAGGYPGVALVRDALNLVHDRLVDCDEDPFALSAEQSSSFRFDWRRDYVPIDVGFSPNEHKNIVMQGYPVVELLAAIGLANARPYRHNRLKYSYGIAGVYDAKELYDPIFLRIVLGAQQAPFSGMPFRLFRAEISEPGKEGQARCVADVIEEVLL